MKCTRLCVFVTDADGLQLAVIVLGVLCGVLLITVIVCVVYNIYLKRKLQGLTT